MNPNTPQEQQEILAAIKRGEPIQMNALSNTGISDTGKECGWLSCIGLAPSFGTLKYRVDTNYKPQQKESTEMTNLEKIAIIQAYEAGEEIETRSKDGDRWDGRNFKPDWSVNPHPVFDFYGFEYRIKPKVTSGQRIRDLIKQHRVDDTKFLAGIIFHQRSSSRSGEFMWGDFQVTVEDDGRARVGCEVFTWEEIDAYAKEEGWWK